VGGIEHIDGSTLAVTHVNDQIEAICGDGSEFVAHGLGFSPLVICVKAKFKSLSPVEEISMR
jgi:hypothetical protein